MTRYEITARRNGCSVLIGYTPRRSKPGLLAALQKHGPALVAFLRLGDDDQITFHDSPPHAVVSGWRLGFTGRTQASARQEGELPFLLDVQREETTT